MCEVVMQEQPVALRTCNKCHVALPLADFYPSRTRPDGWQLSCKKCSKIASQKSAAKNKARESVVTPLSQTCFSCGIEKTASCFAVSMSLKSGLQRNCKECGKKKCKNNRAKNGMREKVRPGSKECSCCRFVKAGEKFFNVKTTADGLDFYCKECRKVSNKESKLESRYGVSVAWLTEMLKKQNNGCAICSVRLDIREKKTCVDHDHLTGAPRGVLCGRCNPGIGFFRDNRALIQEAVEYCNYWSSASIDILGRAPVYDIAVNSKTGFITRLRITKEEKNRILKEQGFSCKICKAVFSADRRPHLDHCHKTGLVRGYLCGLCNIGLGFFDDSVPLMVKALSYLLFYESRG